MTELDRVHPPTRWKTRCRRCSSDLWGWSISSRYGISELLRRDQIVTTIASAVLVVLLTSMALRSLLLGLAAVAPLVIGITSTAALMAAAGLCRSTRCR